MQRNKGKRQATIVKRVARGARFLDRVKPDWFNLINLDELNLASGCSCVLGQIVRKESAGADSFWSGYGAVAIHEKPGTTRVDPQLLQIRRNELSHIDNLQALVMPGFTAKRYGFHLTVAQMADEHNEWDALTAEWKWHIIVRRTDAALASV